MDYKSVRKLVFSGVFIGLGLVLPFLTGQIPSIGNKLLPMHIPVLIAGFVLGWKHGLIIGFIIPILRSLLFGMPPMFPIAIAMAFELGTYGFLTGLLYELFPKKNLFIYITLILSMIFGRIVWGAASFFLFGINSTAFTWEMFVAGAFVNAIIGMVIQIIIIPIIVASLKKGKLIING